MSLDDAADPLSRLSHERSERRSRVEFQAQLDGLEEQLVAAATEPATAILPVTRAFLDADHGATQDWVRRNRVVAGACRAIEDDCYVVLARQSPVAGDLRRVVTTLRATGDVHRTGSLLGHIAGSLTWVDPPRLPERIRALLQELAEVVSAIFAGAVDALRARDGLAAVELQQMDDRADELQKHLLTEIYGGDCAVEVAVSLALMARYFERIGDHGVALARGVAYAVTGDRITEPD